MNDLYIPESLDRYRAPWPQRADRWHDHLPFIYDLTASAQPRLVVDLTLGDGEQACFAICQAMKDFRVDGLLYAFGKPADAQANNRHNRDHYAGFSYQMDALPEQPEQRFAPGSIELLHIDCAAETDAADTLARWQPLLAPGALVLLHGINSYQTLWQDCQRSGASFLFPAGEGLGVLRLGTDATALAAGHTPLLALLLTDHDHNEQLQALYQHVVQHLSLKGDGGI